MPRSVKKPTKKLTKGPEYTSWSVAYCAKRGLVEVIRRGSRDPAHNKNDAIATQAISAILRRARQGSKRDLKLWTKASGFGQGRKIDSASQARDDAYLTVLLAKNRTDALDNLVESFALTVREAKLNAEIAKSYKAARGRAGSGRTKPPTLPLSKSVRLTRADLYKIFAAVDRLLDPLQGRKHESADFSGKNLEKRLIFFLKPKETIRSRTRTTGIATRSKGRPFPPGHRK